MPRTCSVCKAPNRLLIEETLLGLTPLRTISRRFGLSTAALHRHKRGHLLQKLVRAEEAKQVCEANTLLAKVESLITKCEALSESAREKGAWAGSAQALNALTRALDLLGRVSGQLRSGGVQVGIAIGERPEELRATLDNKLRALLEA